MTLSYSKKLVLGLVFSGLCAQANGMSIFANVQKPSNSKIAIAAAATFAAVSSYVALTQEKQPAIQTNNPALKLWNWYRRSFCGQASKKSQKGYLTQTQAHINVDGTIDFDADLKIKDCYSESSGYVGNAITWYDSNEKDVKKALGIGALIAFASFNTDVKDFFGTFLKSAPYNEGFKIAK